jgi:four helix bundle protein
MNAEEMKKRTKAFAVEVIKLAEELPSSPGARTIQGQLIRSCTSVGSNYRASCRARSVADFVAKMGIVEEEADESAYWMELLVEAGILPPERIQHLHEEVQEILAITVSSIKTARKNNGVR